MSNRTRKLLTILGGDGETAPAAPASLTATAVSASQIDLAWTDSSPNETGFNIYRDDVLIHTTAADATSYSDTGLDSNTLYEYYVTAENAAGESAASNTDSATTDMTYIEKLVSYGFDFVWPMNELSGTTAANAVTPGTGDGTFSGVTLDSIDGPVTGDRAGLWAPATPSYCNVYSAALASAWTPAALTVAIWFRVSAAGVWSDGANRGILHIGSQSTNRVRIHKDANNNQLRLSYIAGGTTKQTIISGVSSTLWNHLALTVDVAGDEAITYLNGVQQGVTLTGLGTWAGALVSTICTLGIESTAGTNPFSGYLAHGGFANRVLTPAEVADIATPT